MDSNKKEVIRIGVSALLFAAGIILKITGFEIICAIVFGISTVVSGYDVFFGSVKKLLRGRLLDEKFLMSVAAAGAFVIGEYPEGAAVMLFYQVGEMFQDFAVDKSRESISKLLDIRPDSANLKLGNKITAVDPGKVRPGDIIVVRPGEKVPLDCTVTDGSTSLDVSALTGESMPKEIFPGDEILSGSVNGGGLITAEVTKPFKDSTVKKILDLVENASENKSVREGFVNGFAKIYTPVVVFSALLLAVLPPLLSSQSFSESVYRALTFLVVSCPCALVVSVPLGFFSGIGAASKSGILVKGGNFLEALAKTQIAVFDKTGTLTQGKFSVSSVRTFGCEEAQLLKTAAYVEYHSNHPAAKAIVKSFGEEIKSEIVSDYEEIPGFGVTAKIGGKEAAAGNFKLISRLCAGVLQPDEFAGTAVHVCKDGKYLGYIAVSDEIKPDSKKAVAQLRKLGVEKTVMLTGDRREIAEKVADSLNIDEIGAELLPADKVEKVRELLSAKDKNSSLVFVGDGLNDAPVLALSDIGVSMGGVGSDAAIEAADIVLMTDEPSKLAEAIKISRKTLRIVRENIVFSLAVKLLVLIFGAFGAVPMWLAVIADVGVSVLAVLNSLRLLIKARVKSKD